MSGGVSYETAQRVTNAAVYIGAGTAITSGFSTYELGVYGGLLIALIFGLANAYTNWHWKQKDHDVLKEYYEHAPKGEDRRAIIRDEHGVIRSGGEDASK